MLYHLVFHMSEDNSNIFARNRRSTSSNRLVHLHACFEVSLKMRVSIDNQYHKLENSHQSPSKVKTEAGFQIDDSMLAYDWLILKMQQFDWPRERTN